jgi:hypothetical protein
LIFFLLKKAFPDSFKLPTTIIFLLHQISILSKIFLPAIFLIFFVKNLLNIPSGQSLKFLSGLISFINPIKAKFNPDKIKPLFFFFRTLKIFLYTVKLSPLT